MTHPASLARPTRAAQATPPGRWPRWLLARRLVQIGVLVAFGSGTWWGVVVATGTLSSSHWVGGLELTDPFMLLQLLVSGQTPAVAAWMGAAMVAMVSALLAGRLFCAWVCPVNLLTDAVAGLRRWMGWSRVGVVRVDRRLRFVLLLLVLLGAALSGRVVWEAINPISASVRAIAYGLWAGALLPLGLVILVELLVPNGWCGHLCPVGACHAALGYKTAQVHVEAAGASACTRCGDCYAICPEPQVLVGALSAKGIRHSDTPLSGPMAPDRTIKDSACLRCGRCMDVCTEPVFTWRVGSKVFAVKGLAPQGEPQPHGHEQKTPV